MGEGDSGCPIRPAASLHLKLGPFLPPSQWKYSGSGRTSSQSWARCQFGHQPSRLGKMEVERNISIKTTSSSEQTKETKLSERFSTSWRRRTRHIQYRGTRDQSVVSTISSPPSCVPPS